MTIQRSRYWPALLAAVFCSQAWSAPPPLSNPDVSPEPAEGTAYDGVLDGQAAVSAAGNAAYSIPIQLPPGRNELTPRLSINYNSNMQNGMLGLGWFLSGTTSKINRCPKTLAQEGESRPVRYDEDDVFCLDGHKLIAVSGTYGAIGTYGASGTLYRTGIDQFSSIRSVGASGGVAINGPTYFEVKTKGGLTKYYGYSGTGGRVEGQGSSVVREWALDRVEDRSGNYYKIYYNEQNSAGIHYITSIKYNSHDLVNSGAPDTEVNFLYENRNDSVVRYEAGSKVQRTPKRLSEIEIRQDGVPVYNYELNYQQVGVDSRSRLTSVTRCAGSVCESPITLQWLHNGSPSYTASTLNVPYAGMMNHNSIGSALGFSYNTPRWHDMNGDGKPDYVLPLQSGGNYPANNMTFRIKFQTSGGYTTQDWQAGLGGHPKDFHWVDIDGDGRTDVVKLDQVYGKIESALAGNGQFINGSAYDDYAFDFPYSSGYGGALWLSDVNGDGLIDIVKRVPEYPAYPNGHTHIRVHINKGNGQGFYSQNEWLVRNNTQPADFALMDLNGDGLDDIVYQGRYVYANTGSSFENTALDLGATPGGFDPVSFADVNGDGMQDRYVLQSNGACCNVQINTGNAFVSGSTSDKVASRMLDDNRLLDVFDRNAPGRNVSSSWYPYDYTRPPQPPKPYSTYLYRRYSKDSTGSSYQNQSDTFSSENLSAFLQWVDLDADGLLDLTVAQTGICDVSELQAHIGGTLHHSWEHKFCETGVHKVFTANGAPLNLLKKVTQGQGVETIFTYKPLTDTSVYTKGNSAQFPDFDIQDTTQVVSRMQQSNGIGGHSTVDYTYEGLVRNVQGRGDKGFARITASDTTADAVTITEYAQQFPYTSQPIHIEVRRASDNRLLKSTDISYSVVSTAAPNVVFPYVQNRIEKSYALSDGRLLSTNTTTNAQVDSYGNIGLTTTILDDHEQGDVFKQEVDSQFTVTSVHSVWRVSDLTSVVQRAWLNGVNDPSKDRRTDYTYEAGTGLLKTETTEPGRGAGIEKVRTLAYDSYGNLLSETLSGPGITTRSSSVVYDARHKFPATLTNAEGHEIDQTWDPVFGNKLTEADVNDQVTHWAYDDFGRLERVTNPDGTFTETQTYTYNGTSISHAAFYTETLSSGKAPVRVYYDKLGRKLRTRTQAFDGQHVNVDINYDSRGRDYRTSEPYFDGAPVVWNTNTYDHLNRVTSLAAADPVKDMTFAYDGFQTTTTDALSRSEVRESDARGQIIEVVDKAQTVMQFDYDAVGNRVAVHNAVGTALANSVTYSYDRLGRLTSQDDPDHGLYTYTYDAFGNKLTEVSPKMAAAGQSVSYGYDKLDRMVSRSEPEGTTTWTYDETANGNLGVGQLHSESQGGFTKIHKYAAGNYGRLTTVETTVDGNAYETRYEYDANGRVQREYYPASNADPSGFRVEYLYSPVGPLEAVQSPGGGTVYYQLIATDAAGRITEEWKGDGSTLTQGYAGHSSRMTSQQSVNVSGSTFQHFAYDYDNAGNMTDRSDLVHSLDETFTYDDLDRLTSSQVGAGTVQNYGFDATGNLTQKTSDYTYGYNLSQLHAVSDITGAGSLPDHSYGYDANGNLETIDSTPTITWSSYNKPVQISSGGASYQFSYGPDRKRYRKIHNGETTHYIGANFEAIGNPATGMDVFRHFIRANGKVVMIREDDQGTTRHYYVHRDHLGSLTALTIQSSGAVLERSSYDAWGKRRDASDWVSNAPATNEIRGYTGHEHLDDVGIIHMNGRVYAPEVGRMLSPDPVTQAPENGQNYNRYAYAFNNPLKFTDPSGYRSTRRWAVYGITEAGTGQVTTFDFTPGNDRTIAPMVGGYVSAASVEQLGSTDFSKVSFSKGGGGSKGGSARKTAGDRADHMGDAALIVAEGGVASILSNAANISRIADIRNILGDPNVDSVREFLVSLNQDKYGGLEDFEINMHAYNLSSELSAIGVSELTEAVQSTLQLMQSELNSLPVTVLAKALGVSKTAVFIIDISLATGDIPPEYTETKSKIDMLIEKHSE